MGTFQDSQLWALLAGVFGESRTGELFTLLTVPDDLRTPSNTSVSRAVLAQALNMALFSGLIARVPTASAYVHDVRASGGRILFDHGAVRTVAAARPFGIPAGRAAITRILEPLGFRISATYPLLRLNMTGHALTHEDMPEDIAQYFVSELHPERFSPAFQDAVDRVIPVAHDPIDAAAAMALTHLARDASLPMGDAQSLLPRLVACFDRLHAVPSIEDYEQLLAESAEMAWIATEGNIFNHATDRVEDLVRITEEQRRLARPIKETIEVSANGRVRQTAFRADRVPRIFRCDATGSHITRDVPGSFYEFISRAYVPGRHNQPRLDLSFDTSNAQGIFTMTGH